jgi:lysophospholipase L1-like esterase
MSDCNLTGTIKGYDGSTSRPGTQLKVIKVLPGEGSTTVFGTHIATHTLLSNGTWWPLIKIERKAVAYVYCNAPGFDASQDHGTPLQIPDASSAPLASLAAAVSLPSQVLVALTPATPIVVKASDGSPSYSSVSEIQFDDGGGFMLDQPSPGKVRVRIDGNSIPLTSPGTGTSSTGTLAFNADSDGNGSGKIAFQINSVEQASVENDGSFRGHLNGSDITSATVERDRFGRYFLRNLQSIIAKIRTGNNAVANIVWLGDSIGQIGYVYNPLMAALKAILGDAGVGFLRFDVSNAVYGTAGGVTGTWVETTRDGAARGIQCASINSTVVNSTASIAGSSCIATSIDVIYVKQSGGGTFEVSIDGGAYAHSTSTANASLDIGVLSITGLTYGQHDVTVKVTAAGSSGVGLTGANFKIDDVPGVRSHLAANTGSLASQFAAMNATTFENGLLALDGTLFMLEWGHNEAGAVTPIADYVATLQTIIDRIRAKLPLADILLVATDKGTALPAGTQMIDYALAVLDLARANDNVAYVDWYKWMGDWDDADARGLFDDAAHPSLAGGRVLADQTMAFLGDGVGGWHQGGIFAGALGIPYGLAGPVTIPYAPNPFASSYAQKVSGPNEPGADNLWQIGNYGFDMGVDLTHANGLSIGDTIDRADFRIVKLGAGVFAMGLGTNAIERLRVMPHGGSVPGVVIEAASGQSVPVFQSRGGSDLRGLGATHGESLVIDSVSEEITLATGATTTDSSANLLPAGALILSVTARVTTTITTAANWKVGDATTANRADEVWRRALVASLPGLRAALRGDLPPAWSSVLLLPCVPWSYLPQ